MGLSLHRRPDQGEACGGGESKKIWLLAKILRDARYTGAWEFITVRDFPAYRERLLPRFSRERKLWEFLYTQCLAHGIVKPDEHSESAGE